LAPPEAGLFVGGVVVVLPRVGAAGPVYVNETAGSGPACFLFIKNVTSSVIGFAAEIDRLVGSSALAGIWNHRENKPPTIVVETYAIVTCEPGRLLRPLHDRMPVILRADDYDRRLDAGDPQNPPMDLLKPFPDVLMKALRIKPDVGNTRNDRPDLIDPIDPIDPSPDLGDQPSLF
jgi:SOS response associated peptidase (SRAP)